MQPARALLRLRRAALVAASALVLAAALAACRPPSQPALEVSPATRSIQGAEPGMVLTITNPAATAATLDVVVTAESPRLTPAVGTASLGPGASVAINVFANRSGLTAPEHATIVVAGGGESRTVEVELLPRLSLCDFGAPAHAPGPTDTPWAPAPAAVPAVVSGRAGEPVPGQLLVSYAPGVVAPMAGAPGLGQRTVAAAALASLVGARIVRQGVGAEHDLLEVADGDVERALSLLRRDPRVLRAAPNLYVERSAAPDDAFYPAQWNLNCFGSEQAWAIEDGSGPGDPVVISVVDDGINLQHVDLQGKLVAGWDFHGDDGDVGTAEAHGSHVASLAAATGNNAKGIAGVAHGERVLIQAVKVFPDDEGPTTTDVVLRGLRWAGGLPAEGAPPNATPGDVINLSLGFGRSPNPSTVAFFEDVVEEILAAGGLVVAASGNGGSGVECGSLGVQYPARIGSIVAVGSVDFDGARSCFSDYGIGLDLVAPGGLAPADLPAVGGVVCPAIWGAGRAPGPERMACMSGTSMAAPHVSGTAALLIAADASLRAQPEALRARLIAAAIPTATHSPLRYGAGLLCPDAALGAATACGRTP